MNPSFCLESVSMLFLVCCLSVMTVSQASHQHELLFLQGMDDLDALAALEAAEVKQEAQIEASLNVAQLAAYRETQAISESKQLKRAADQNKLRTYEIEKKKFEDEIFYEYCKV